jgi:hypothetical protein
MADEYIQNGTMFYRVSDQLRDNENVRDTTLHTSFGDLSDGQSPALSIKPGNDSSLALFDFIVPPQPTYGGTHDLYGLDFNFTTVAAWNHRSAATQSGVQGDSTLPSCNIYLMKNKERLNYEGGVDLIDNDGITYSTHVNSGSTFERADIALFVSHATDDSSFFNLGEDFSGTSDIADTMYKYVRKGRVVSGKFPYLSVRDAAANYSIGTTALATTFGGAFTGPQAGFTNIQPSIMSGFYGSYNPDGSAGRIVKIQPSSGNWNSMPPEVWHPATKEGQEQGILDHPVSKAVWNASPLGLIPAGKGTIPTPSGSSGAVKAKKSPGLNMEWLSKQGNLPALPNDGKAVKASAFKWGGRGAKFLGKASWVAMPAFGAYYGWKAGEERADDLKEARESGDFSGIKRPYFEPIWDNDVIKDLIKYGKTWEDFEINERDENACTTTTTWWDKIKEVKDYPKASTGAGGSTSSEMSYGSSEDMLAKSSINFSNDNALNGGNMRMQCYHDLDLSSTANTQLDFNFGSNINQLQQDIYACKYNIPQPARIFQNNDGYSNANVEPPAKYEISFKMNVTEMAQQYSVCGAGTAYTSLTGADIIVRRGFAVTFSAIKPGDNDSFNDYIQRHGPTSSGAAWASHIAGFVIQNPLDMPGDKHQGLEVVPIAAIQTGTNVDVKGEAVRGIKEHTHFSNDLVPVESTGPVIPANTWLEFKLTTDLHGNSGTSEKLHGRFGLSIYHAGTGELIDTQKDGGDWEGPLTLISAKDVHYAPNTEHFDHETPTADSWLPHMTFWVINHRYNAGTEFNKAGDRRLGAESGVVDSDPGTGAAAVYPYTHDAISGAMVAADAAGAYGGQIVATASHNQPYFLGKTSVHIDDILIKNAEAKKVNWSINEGNTGNIILENKFNNPNRIAIRPSNEPSWAPTRGASATDITYDVTPTVLSLGFESPTNLISNEPFNNGTCETTDGSATINIDAGHGVVVGDHVYGAGIQEYATIAVSNATSVVMNKTATATADPVTLTFGTPKFLLFNDFSALEANPTAFADANMKAGFQDDTTNKMGDFTDAYMTQTTDIGVNVSIVANTTHTAGYRPARATETGSIINIYDTAGGGGSPTAHNLSTGARVSFSNLTTTSPAISSGQSFYVKETTATAFQLTDVQGGSVVAFTGDDTVGECQVLETHDGDGFDVILPASDCSALLKVGDIITLGRGAPFTDSTCDIGGVEPLVVAHDINPLIIVGLSVAGGGIPSGATITTITDSTHFVLSAPATATENNVELTFEEHADAAKDKDGNTWVEFMEVTAVSNSGTWPITVKRDITNAAQGAQQPNVTAGKTNSIFKVGNSLFNKLSIGNNNGYDIITGQSENDAWDKNRTTNDKCYVDGFSQKGFLQFENKFTNWARRENIYSSTRVTGIGGKNKDGSATLTANKALIQIADSTAIGFESDEKYIIYKYGSTFGTAGITAFNTGSGSAAIVTIQEVSGNNGTIITVIKDESSNWGGSGKTGRDLDGLITEANLPTLFISPYRYWLNIQIDAMDTTTQPATRGYGSVVAVAEPKPPASGFDLGVTFNERRFYTNTSGKTSYNDSRSFDITQSPKDIPYVTNTDFGFGSYDSDSEAGGQLSSFKPQFGSNRIPLHGIANSQSGLEGGRISLLMQATANNTPQDELHIWSGDFDAADTATPSANDQSRAIPQLVAKYIASTPRRPGLKVTPNEGNPFYPEFLYTVGDDNLWYGYLMVDNEEIENKYHDVAAYIPLNENMSEPWLGKRDSYRGGGDNTWKKTKMYGSKESIGKEAINVANPIVYATTDGIYSSAVQASEPFQTLEGLAGRAMDTTYNHLVMPYREDYSTWHTNIATSKGCSVVTHLISNSAAADNEILSLNGKSASITAFADGTGGKVTVTSAGHDISDGEVVIIAGTTNYNGTFVVSNKTTNTFKITDTWVSDDGTGTWEYPEPIKISVVSSKVVAKVYDEDGNYVELTSVKSLPRNGETPSCIILTIDPDLTYGNVKLFLDGKLEAMSESSTTTTNNSKKWGNGKKILNNGTKTTNLLLGKFKGIYEEFIMYSHIIYPVEFSETQGSIILEKPLEEISNGTGGHPQYYNAKLFIFDYHNLRGEAVSQSEQVSWKKTSFNIDGT